jgi:hypothetical protein
MATCKDCFYSREFDSETAVACHRWPPTITKVEGTTVTSNFPLVNNSTWCGEYRVNELAPNKKFRAISRGVTK